MWKFVASLRWASGGTVDKPQLSYKTRCKGSSKGTASRAAWLRKVNMAIDGNIRNQLVAATRLVVWVLVVHSFLSKPGWSETLPKVPRWYAVPNTANQRETHLGSRHIPWYGAASWRQIAAQIHKVSEKGRKKSSSIMVITIIMANDDDDDDNNNNNDNYENHHPYIILSKTQGTNGNAKHIIRLGPTMKHLPELREGQGGRGIRWEQQDDTLGTHNVTHLAMITGICGYLNRLNEVWCMDILGMIFGLILSKKLLKPIIWRYKFGFSYPTVMTRQGWDLSNHQMP